MPGNANIVLGNVRIPYLFANSNDFLTTLSGNALFNLKKYPNPIYSYLDFKTIISSFKLANKLVKRKKTFLRE